MKMASSNFYLDLTDQIYTIPGDSVNEVENDRSNSSNDSTIESASNTSASKTSLPADASGIII